MAVRAVILLNWGAEARDFSIRSRALLPSWGSPSLSAGASRRAPPCSSAAASGPPAARTASDSRRLVPLRIPKQLREPHGELREPIAWNTSRQGCPGQKGGKRSRQAGRVSRGERRKEEGNTHLVGASSFGL
eukprot:3598290-Rhodomonas_salina.5